MLAVRPPLSGGFWLAGRHKPSTIDLNDSVEIKGRFRLVRNNIHFCFDNIGHHVCVNKLRLVSPRSTSSSDSCPEVAALWASWQGAEALQGLYKNVSLTDIADTKRDILRLGSVWNITLNGRYTFSNQALVPTSGACSDLKIELVNQDNQRCVRLLATTTWYAFTNVSSIGWHRMDRR